MAVGGLGAGQAAPASAAPAFDRREIAVSTQLLFDLGVVDFDRDDDLDVFTVNHNDPQSMLVNRGDGRFVDRLSALRLDQSPQFPGFEDPEPPWVREDGLYLFRTPGNDAAEGALRLRVRAAPAEEVSGRIAFLFPVAVNRDDGAEVSIDFDRARVPTRYMARFSTQGDALIELEPEQMAAPVEVEIDDPIGPSKIHVGSRAVSPLGQRFTLNLRDRHGMTWADFNGDGLLDLFISRGGLKRRVGEFAGLISDELVLGAGSSFRDAIGAAGIVKGACRGRETSPVDFNSDGRLDIFYGCLGSNPALWGNNEDGTFADHSAELSSPRISGGHYKWIDIAGDRSEELLTSRGKRLIVFGRALQGPWKKLQGTRTFGKTLTRPAAADYDDDGDPDLFVASPHRNTLLINRRGKLRPRPPGRFGLPTHGSFAVSWVDYDNDRRTDLYAAPQGVFRRTGKRRFKRTGLTASPRGTADALASWFDYDGDGARDLLLAHADRGWSARLVKNRQRDNHWLQVELRGENGAYPALGARVTVRSGRRAQTQWVGQNDGSRYSFGHYRLYFGLGDVRKVATVTVVWPDGTRRVLKDVATDRLLHVSFERR